MLLVYVNNSAFRSESFKVMTYNVEESGVNPDWELVVKEENPDVFLAIETGLWDDNNNQTFIQYVNDLNSYWTSIGEGTYNWTFVEQGVSWSTQGYAVMSRYPIRNVYAFDTVTLDNGTLYSADFIDAEIVILSVTIHVIGIHLKCCPGYDARREAQMEGIINYMDSLGGNVPIILMGDFNSYSPEDTGDLAPNGDLGAGPVTLLLDPHNPRGSLYHNFTDAYRTLNPLTPGYTYHGSSSLLSRIDFIFVNDYFELGELLNSTVGDTLHADTGSDHYSVDTYIQLVQGLDSIPPTPVSGFHASLITPSSITLQWNSNSESDFNYYALFRNNTLLKNTTLTWYQDTGLPENTTYVYSIYALDFSGNLSNKTTLLLATSFLHVPNSPEQLTISLGSSSAILSWSPPSNQGNATVKYYRIYRANSSGIFTARGITSLTSYTDTNVLPGINFTYYVVAVNEKGESSPSNMVTAFIPVSNTTTLTSTTTQLPTSIKQTTTNESSRLSEPLDSTKSTLFSNFVIALIISNLLLLTIVMYLILQRRKS